MGIVYVQWLQRPHNIWPCRWPVRLKVHKQIQCLLRIRIIDAVVCYRSHVRTCRVLALQHVQDGIDVQGLEGPFARQGALLVADVQRVIVQPYIGFDGDGADGKRAVEGEGSPVVVVAVDIFGDYALS